MHRPHSTPLVNDRLKRDFRWVDRIAWIMDEKFHIRAGRFRFGWDPLINLIPFLGDIIGFGVSLMLIMVMWRNGASRKVVMLMLINVILDTTIGAIPVIGNVFDFFFKANTKNILLLREYYYQGKHRGKGNDVLAFIFGLVLLLTFGFIYLLWESFVWFVGTI